MTVQLAWWQPAAESRADTTEGVLPFCMLLAFTFVMVLSPQSFIPALRPLRLAFLFAATAAAAFVLQRFVAKRPLIDFSPAMTFALLLLAWSVVTVPLSIWPGSSAEALLDTYMKSLIVFWLLAHVVNTPQRLRIFVWALALMTIPIAVTAIRNFVTGNLYLGRIRGYESVLASNPNDLALILNLIIPLAAALALTARARWQRLLMLGIIGVAIAGIIVTFSRTGFLTLATIGLFYFLHLFRHRRGGTALLVVALLLGSLSLIPAEYTSRLTTITNIEADETGSAQLRSRDMVLALEYVIRNPIIGAGIGNNALALNELRGPHWVDVHNVYLQQGMELGVPGVVLYVLLILACLRAARAARLGAGNRADQGELATMAHGIGVSLIAFIVAAMFHPVAYHFYFYLIGGLALAAGSIGRSHS